jgi:hypothetical protein
MFKVSLPVCVLLAGALAAEASWRSCWDFVTGRLASPTGTPYCIAPLPCWAAR